MLVQQRENRGRHLASSAKIGSASTSRDPRAAVAAVMGGDADLPNSVHSVRESFQDPKFVDRIDVLININIPRNPRWGDQFRKYQKLYEDQLQLALATSGVEVLVFMEYVCPAVQRSLCRAARLRALPRDARELDRQRRR